MYGCWYWPENQDDDGSGDFSEDNDDVSATEDAEEESGESLFRRRSVQVARNKRSSWKLLSDKEILSQYAENGSQFVDDDDYVSPDFWPCSIITKDNGGGKINATYTVRIFQSKSHRTAPWEEENEPLFLTNYPRSSIRYFVKPYRRSQHSQGAFRHSIGLPNDMWPEKWRNRPRGDRQGQYQIGDRVIFLSSSNKEKTGIVVHFDVVKGYDIFSLQSGSVSTGIDPASILKLEVRLKEVEIDPIYA